MLIVQSDTKGHVLLTKSTNKYKKRSNALGGEGSPQKAALCCRYEGNCGYSYIYVATQVTNEKKKVTAGMEER